MQVSVSGGERGDRDVFRLAPSMDESMMTTIAERLENRGTDPGYTQLSQAYFAHESVLSVLARTVWLVCCRKPIGFSLQAERWRSSTATTPR
jgi:hypothetical protein